jgi:hypothetical protein
MILCAMHEKEVWRAFLPGFSFPCARSVYRFAHALFLVYFRVRSFGVKLIQPILYFVTELNGVSFIQTSLKYPPALVSSPVLFI